MARRPKATASSTPTAPHIRVAEAKPPIGIRSDLSAPMLPTFIEMSMARAARAKSSAATAAATVAMAATRHTGAVLALTTRAEEVVEAVAAFVLTVVESVTLIGSLLGKQRLVKLG